MNPDIYAWIDIADTNVVVARLRADLDALLSDSTLSGEVLDAIVEIKTLLLQYTQHH